MESQEVLPIALRLEGEQIMDIFREFGDEIKFEELVNKVLTYERALVKIENDFHKWNLTKGKFFAEFFIWGRVKENEQIAYGKFTYYAFLDRLNKYSNVLPRAEAFYEEKRKSKLDAINAKLDLKTN